MKILNLVEKFSANCWRVDLTSAVAAGLCAGAVTSLINALYHPVNLRAYARVTILAIAAYLIIASLWQAIWGDLLKRMLPSWIVIAFYGSVLFVTVRLLPGVIKGWTDPHRVDQSLIEFISTEMAAARSVIAGLAFITLPITALFHYSGHIARAVRAWHNGPQPLSIRRSALKR